MIQSARAQLSTARIEPPRSLAITTPSSPDCFDPRYWPEPPSVRRIYLHERDLTLFALVDAIDYDWALRWLWSATPCRKRITEKWYASRVSHRTRIYLHKEILMRSVGPPPTAKHRIGDHRNGDSLDCTRANLRWATPAMNAKNVFGAYPRDLVEDYA